MTRKSFTSPLTPLRRRVPADDQSKPPAFATASRVDSATNTVPGTRCAGHVVCEIDRHCRTSRPPADRAPRGKRQSAGPAIVCRSGIGQIEHRRQQRRGFGQDEHHRAADRLDEPHRGGCDVVGEFGQRTGDARSSSAGSASLSRVTRRGRRSRRSPAAHPVACRRPVRRRSPPPFRMNGDAPYLSGLPSSVRASAAAWSALPLGPLGQARSPLPPGRKNAFSAASRMIAAA